MWKRGADELLLRECDSAASYANHKVQQVRRTASPFVNCDRSRYLPAVCRFLDLQLSAKRRYAMVSERVNKQVSKVQLRTKGQVFRTIAQNSLLLDRFPLEFALEAPLERPLLPMKNFSRLQMYLGDSKHTITSIRWTLAAGVLTAARRPTIGRTLTAVLVATVAVPEYMPQKPADYPVLFFQALGIPALVIKVFRFWSGTLIDVQDLSMHGSLADLRVTERRLSVLHAIVSKDVWC